MIRKWLERYGPGRSVSLWRYAIILTLISSLAGCGGSSKPISVKVSAAASTVDGTDSTTLTAAVTNDKNGDGVTWSVSGGGSLSSQTKTSATYTAPAATSSAVTVTVTATSIANTKESAKATITVPAAPTLATTNANLTGQVGTAYSVQLQGSGGIPPYVNWALASNNNSVRPAQTSASGVLPPCITLSSSGLLSSSSPPPASCAGTFTNLVFTFSDSGKPTPLTATTAAMTITIAAAPAITFPAPSASVPGPATYGEAYSGSVAATGGAGTLSYTLVGALPGGLSLSAGTGAISGTPTAVGTFPFSVSATDAFGDAATSPAYSITVSYGAITITPAAGSLPGGTVGVAYSQKLTASGGSGTGYTWTVTGLPEDGLDYAASGSTVTVSGTPTSAETVTITASVTDSASNTAGPYTYTIAVASSSGGSQLQGTYVCMIQGFQDSSGYRIASLASFQADGKGNLTGGAYDANRQGKTPDTGTLTGTYSIGADGNGTVSETATSSVTSTQETHTFALAVNPSVTPAQQFSLVESDDAGSTPAGRHSLGNCYLATPSAFAASTLSGNSFVWHLDGEDSSGDAMSSAGRIVFGASGMTVTGGASDTATAGDTSVKSSTITGGSFTAPGSTTGRTPLTLELPKNGTTASASYVIYLIDTNCAFVMEIDTIGPGDLAVGEVRRQQESTYSGANIDGAFVFYTQGLEFSTSGSNTPTGDYAIVYQGTGSGTGDLTIAQSYMDDTGTYTAGSATGSVAVAFDTSVPGRATISANAGTVVLYLFDTNSAFEVSGGGSGGTSVESGRLEPQTQTTFTDAALAGTYMMTELAPLEASALDQNGILTVGSNGTLQGQLTAGGSGTYNFDQSLSATYAWDTTASGTGTFLAPSPAVWSCAVINSTRFACVDQTVNPPAMRIFQQ